jgi:hypothetical protein
VLKYSNHSQRGISQPKLGFITNHSNLTKGCKGELTKDLGRVFSLVEPTPFKGGRGKDFILVPQNLAIENYLVETETDGFGNQNIQNLKYSRYRKNWTLWFRKPDCLIFSGSARCVVYEAIVFHSYHVGF